MSEYVSAMADLQNNLAKVGGKGASLARLSSAGLPVPDGFHVMTSAYRHFVDENHLKPIILDALKLVDISKPDTLEHASTKIRALFNQAEISANIIAEIENAYAHLPGTNPVVAVRSSATAEDLPELSFAGQQDSYLNIKGVDSLLEAVKQCWASLWTARAIGYRTRNHIDQNIVSLAVVVQLLIPAESSGILFTANPINGNPDEMVINAAWGLGESIVGGLVTPDTLTLDKANGRVLSRQTADKRTMTVRVNGGTEEQPVPDRLRMQPVINDAVAADLVHLGQQIEKLFNTPSDIEWAWENGKLHILQARPITTLPEYEPDPPDEWPMPHPKGKYMRTSIIDIVPDPLSPLFATMGLDIINLSLKKWLTGMINRNNALPDDTLMTINGYAYYNVTISKKQWWVLITRFLPKFPNMLRTGVRVWREEAHPRYVATVEHWEKKPIYEMTNNDLLRGSYEIMEAVGDHLLSLMASTMGPSAGSEGLFTRVYERLIQKEGDPPAPTFLMGFDSIPIRAEKSLYDLALWCKAQHQLADYLTKTPAHQLTADFQSDNKPEGIDLVLWQEWHERFADYLNHFGYCIYTLDFSHPLPMDNPLTTMEALKLFITGQAKNPHVRQQASEDRRNKATESILSRIGGIRRWIFLKALKWAQSLAPLREDGISEIGLGYPLLRGLLRELGSRFVRVGVIEEPDDIFWLTRDEIEHTITALSSVSSVGSLSDKVRDNKVLWRSRKKVTPPAMLPPSDKYLGINVEAFMAVSNDDESGNIINGLGTSPGCVTATARVLLGPEDFKEMQPGDILVAPITTPAWTPLFTMASGVITDVGGPLSHGSIVAREYGIPAVMGTVTATRRIRSGETVTLDGSAGTVALHSSETEPEAQPA